MTFIFCLYLRVVNESLGVYTEIAFLIKALVMTDQVDNQVFWVYFL